MSSRRLAGEPLKSVKQEIDPRLNAHLRALEQRNRALRAQHDTSGVSRRQQEEGFTLYFAGANTARLTSRTSHNHRNNPPKRNDASEMADFTRSQTAPSARKGWARESAQRGVILTDMGDRIDFHRPDYYSEDFEAVDSTEDDDIEDDCTEEENKMLLSLAEVRALRQSLVQVPNLRESIIERIEYEDSDSEPVSGNSNGTCADDEKVNRIFPSMGVSIETEQRLKSILERILRMQNSQQKKLLRALEQVEFSVDVNQKEINGFTPPPVDDVIVTLNIYSNWGHPSRVGLTQVDFFDRSHNRLQVTQLRLLDSSKYALSDPRVHSIINGRSKTTKERNMWSYPFDSTLIPLTLEFTLSNQDAAMLSQIRIWNYNRSLANLDVGARECQIFLGEREIFKDELERGCGNQAFNYAQVIALDQSAENVSDRRASCSDFSNGLLKCSAVDNSHKYGSSNALQDRLTTSPDNKEVTGLWSTHSEEILSAAQLHRSSKQKAKHIVLQPSPTKDEMKRSPRRVTRGASNLLADTLLSEETDCALAQVRRMCIEASETAADNNKLPEWLSEDNAKTKQDTQDESRVLTPMQVIASARKERLRHINLEKSWAQLDFFNKANAGRISVEVTGDSLDQILNHRGRKEPEKVVVHPAAIAKEPAEPISSIDERKESTMFDDQNFVIPELPCGSVLQICILSTWGDLHYVGLTGVELFSATGHPVVISSITAEPADINVLPNYEGDPRIVANLLDGVNCTRDDVHMWLCPFTPGQRHTVTLYFERASRLAMTRIWNYNKSRIHSSRGARFVEIFLDDNCIFRGEIARAGEAYSIGETILFTEDDVILERVAEHDSAFQDEAASASDDHESGESFRRKFEETQKQRPPTRGEKMEDRETPNTVERPFTCAKKSTIPSTIAVHEDLKKTQENTFCARLVTFCFTETWGDADYIGLAGMQLIDSDGQPFNLCEDQLQAEPRDLRHLPGCSLDTRTLDKLLDSERVTCDDEHMWLVPFSHGGKHMLKIELHKRTPLAGFRVWNYNKSPEDTYRGAKLVQVWLDDKEVSPPEGYLLRKAPGNTAYDFVQEILFRDFLNPDPLLSTASSGSKQLVQSAAELPTGFVFQFNLLNTWSDCYYVGLNAIEFYDEYGEKMDLSADHVAACPDSINVLRHTGVANGDTIIQDVRTPDKLIDGVNDDVDGRHAWLAPLLPGLVNRVFVIFDRPVQVSMIRLWNYSKTPARGVKDFSLLVDDLLIYSGRLPIATPPGVARGILPTCSVAAFYHCILFASDDARMTQMEQGHVLNLCATDQDVMLTNDNQVMMQYKTHREDAPDQKLRPLTSVQRHQKQKSNPSRRH